MRIPEMLSKPEVSRHQQVRCSDFIGFSEPVGVRWATGFHREIIAHEALSGLETHREIATHLASGSSSSFGTFARFPNIREYANNPMPHAIVSTLTHCEIVNSVPNWPASSFRISSKTNREIGYRISISPMTSPSLRRTYQ